MATYSFQDVSATLDGPTGSVDMGAGAANAEEGISVSMSNDRNVKRMGADGEGMNTLRAAKDGRFTVRLLKTSPTNAVLTRMYNAQAINSALWGTNVLIISNSKSGDLWVGREVAIARMPDVNWAQDGDIVEWMFDAVKIDANYGEYN